MVGLLHASDVTLSCFFSRPGRATAPHSFPTRRSSDLEEPSRHPPGLLAGLREIAAPDAPEIGRAHVLNSSHRCISYAVFCLKKKNRPAAPATPTCCALGLAA